MRYCCPNCRAWLDLDDIAIGSYHCCDYCFEPIRVASGLLAQIAAQRGQSGNPLPSDGPIWPAPVLPAVPQAISLPPSAPRLYKRPSADHTGVARWMAAAACLVFLLLFGFITQVYLGHPSAMANPNTETDSPAPVIAPPLIPDVPPANAPAPTPVRHVTSKPVSIATESVPSVATAKPAEHQSFFGMDIPN